MYKTIILSVVLSISSLCFAQNNILKLKPNAKVWPFSISQNEERSFEIELLENLWYNISVEQKGIDIILYIEDKDHKILVKEDSPNGKFGLEKITYSPNVSGKYFIVIKPLNEESNAKQGNYIIQVSQISKKLKYFSKSKLQEDFDILKNAYIETKVGLWYNTYAAFDSISNLQRGKIKDRMSDWDFYKIVAPLTTYTKEGHSFIRPSDSDNDFFRQYGTYFPFFIKILNQKIYVLNDYQNLETKGLVISKINGIDADQILNNFTKIEPADGYNYTSKYKWIETSFSKYLLHFYGFCKSYTIEFTNPKTNQHLFQKITAVNFKTYQELQTLYRKEYPELSFFKPAEFEINDKYARLTINTFSDNKYKGGKEGFQNYLDSVFLKINNSKIKNLIIDIRKNEGGTQGMEDILLSYLIAKAYKKYDYVEVPSFEYSFLEYTDRKGEKDIIKKEFAKEFNQQNDGRYLNKSDQYQGLPPNPIHFDGKVYILISGLTFSGGSEFAALAKNYTNAIFIGEETGGGYYGNTSGDFLKFTLPHTQLKGRIPLCKFVVNTSYHAIPFGRGLMPDHPFKPTIHDILNHYDSELNYTTQLIEKNR